MLSVQSNADDSSIRIALVEDDDNFQRALISAIEGAPDMCLHAMANTRAQGLDMLNQCRADVLLVDLGLPDGCGIDVIRAAHAQWPGCNIMVSTTFADEAHVMQSIEAGAAGYLLKDSAPEMMVCEIRSLHAGGSPISPLIARQILSRFQQPAAPSQPTADAPVTALSLRERQVLEYITKGFTADEIAGLMAISYHTVQTYVRRIYAKLNVTSKAEAIFEAHHQRLVF